MRPLKSYTGLKEGSLTLPCPDFRLTRPPPPVCDPKPPQAHPARRCAAPREEQVPPYLAPPRRSVADCSRLAVQTTERVAPEFPHGSCLVPSRGACSALGGSRSPPDSAAARLDGASAEGPTQNGRGQRGDRAATPEQVPRSSRCGALSRHRERDGALGGGTICSGCGLASWALRWPRCTWLLSPAHIPGTKPREAPYRFRQCAGQKAGCPCPGESLRGPGPHARPVGWSSLPVHTP